MKKVISILAVSIFLTTSCMVTKTNLNGYKESESSTTVIKQKQYYLIGGLIPIGKKIVPVTDASAVIQIKTSVKFGDLLLKAFTGGIVSSQTIEVKK